MRRTAAFSALTAMLFTTACSDDEAKPAPSEADAVSDITSDGGGASDASGDAGGSDTTSTDTGGPAHPDELAALLKVKETEQWQLDGLKAPAYVVRTEGNVPHIYASNPHDLALVQGFIIARDRYFFMMMGGLLGQGRVAEVLGEAAIDSDYEARTNGMTHVAKTLLEVLTDEQKELFDGFAAGVNNYVKQTKAGKTPPPTEAKIAFGLLGMKSPNDLVREIERRDVAGLAAVLVYELGYETGDIGRGHTATKLDTYFEGKPHQDLRRKGAIADLWNHIVPLSGYSSAHGWGLETTDKAPPPPPPPGASASATLPKLPEAMFERLQARFSRWQRLIRRDHEKGFGSNSWAVGKGASKDGHGLLAGDGHLPLTIPSYFYRIGLDTRVLGGGPIHQAGLIIPGMPIMAVGTNGDVAWCQTQLMGDITDWFVEELTLDADGAPASTLFKGKQEKVVAHKESYKIAELKSVILPSKGGTEEWTRYTTFDGRWIADIEGDKVKSSYTPKKGETVVNLGGSGFVVPRDTDKDGKITAVSFDYTGLDKGNMLRALQGFGVSKDVDGVREAMKHLVAYSQNIAAADADGNTFYSGYQAVPCRSDLPRDKDGNWLPGANPSELLDGTKYGGFTIPIGADGKVDEAAGKTDPRKCLVPFAEYPMAKNPAPGYVVTANNDIGDITHDNSLADEKWYVGGPWLAGYRAQRIADLLDDKKTAGATLADMVEIQADVKSALGSEHAPWLVKVLKQAKSLSETDGDKSLVQKRVVDLYEALTQTVVDDIVARLDGWEKAGFAASSGVETFYHKPDATDRKNSVATVIFNAWIARFSAKVFDDEPMPGIWRFSGSTSRARALRLVIAGIGATNPKKLTSWYDKTGQSIFFDVLGTDVVETAEECALLALHDTIAFLVSKGDGEGGGGYGTADSDQWLWGLRHMAKFESTLGDFFKAVEGLSGLTDQFAITSENLPLLGETKLPKGDPRLDLKWFPRGGDAFSVDAAGGTSATKWHYGSGPVFRMAIEMSRDKDGNAQVQGVNMLPGGQSALTDSPYFSDQAKLWLGNKTTPIRFHVAQVVDGAIGRETYTPAP